MPIPWPRYAERLKTPERISSRPPRVSSRRRSVGACRGVMAATVGDRLGVKASGGIRTAADAVALLTPAPPTGLSGTRAVLDGLD